MTKDDLVQRVKQIVGLVKEAKLDDAYQSYRTLFTDPGFAANRPEDQRQALKLMIHMRGAPSRPTPAMLDAHRAAVAPLTALVAAHGEPADNEMLGMCHEMLGNSAGASVAYRAGLQVERELRPQSDLCGALMRRVSLI